MPLDHYVSQVHLKNFYSPALGELMYAIRKTDMAEFPCRAQDVCRIQDGSTNDYLSEPRAVEDFLTTIERGYNASVAALRSGDVGRDAVYVIAGFAAYVATCSPAAMRVNAAPLKWAVEAMARAADRRGEIPAAPVELGEKTLSDMLADGTIEFDIDSKYPQAIGITNILHHAGVFGNSDWEILVNEEPDTPFFTSDYPVAIEQSDDPFVLNRVMPLAPDLAVRIKPDRRRERARLDFPDFQCIRRRLRLEGVRHINRLIVRSAEAHVFYRDDLPWVHRFVDRHKRWRIESATRTFVTDRGEKAWLRLEVQEQPPA